MPASRRSRISNGGFAYLAAAIHRERAGCNDCILLNAGDLVQGRPVSTIFHGLPVFEIANLLGFDAATLGNHEFDYGWPQAQKFLKTAKYPIVTANLANGKGEDFHGQALRHPESERPARRDYRRHDRIAEDPHHAQAAGRLAHPPAGRNRPPIRRAS